MLRICSALVLLAALVGPAGAGTVQGTARVSDGDTFRVAGVTVRLHGIDAPETRQTCRREDGSEWACGRWASDQLRSMTQGRSVTCSGDTQDRYGRLVAKCFVAGVDLGQEMVVRGAAQAYRKYSLDYVDAEKAAFVAARGIWQGDVVAPEAFRSGAGAEPRVARADGCTIKGNISKSGRIYHLPGQENYGRTRIAESKGERWFCSESEARAAGWRRARR